MIASVEEKGKIFEIHFAVLAVVKALTYSESTYTIFWKTKS